MKQILVVQLKRLNKLKLEDVKTIPTLYLFSANSIKILARN